LEAEARIDNTGRNQVRPGGQWPVMANVVESVFWKNHWLRFNARQKA
jgi:hypothetical protein